MARWTLRLAIVFALIGGEVRADEPEVPAPASDAPAPPAPPAPPRYAVPEEAWSALLNRDVSLVYSDGQEVAGTLLTSDGTKVVLALVVTRTVIVVEKSQIAAVRLIPDAASSSLSSSIADVELPPPEHERYLGLHVGGALATAIDLQLRHLYLFVSASLLAPILSTGSWGGVATGAGFTQSFRRDWHFDAFVVATVFWATAFGPEEFGGTLGVGIGVRYTSPRGFELGFRTPVLGLAVNTTFSISSTDRLLLFYLASGATLPLISVGYRF